MKNLFQRVAVALVLVPLLVLLLLKGTQWAVLLLILFVMLLAYSEFLSMMRPKGSSPVLSWVARISGIFLILDFYLTTQGSSSVISPGDLLALLFLAILMISISGRSRREGELLPDVPAMLPVLVGLVYIPYLLGYVVLLRSLPGGGKLVLFILGFTWAVDILAYAVGKTLGKVKLAPALSPSKTKEGAVGGLAGGVVWTLLFHKLLLPGVPLGDLLAISLLMGGVGQVGDLCESAFKRYAGVKDSGALLPGHGGFLDKIDSLLFNAPVFYLFLVYWEGFSLKIWT
ncbi:MAG: phosphatidate cytidylyltransferase [Leptospirillum sp.]